MARLRTRTKVHEAALSLVVEQQVRALTMEGIATRAGVSKQTLYRTWPSTGAILFDALLSRSTDDDGVVSVPDSGDLVEDLKTLANGTIAELTDSTQESLLRTVTAEIQTDRALAAQFRDLLLVPQLRGISDRFRRGGVTDSDAAAELFVGPMFHRWLLRTGPFDPEWVEAHVARTLRAVATV